MEQMVSKMCPAVNVGAHDELKLVETYKLIYSTSNNQDKCFHHSSRLGGKFEL